MIIAINTLDLLGSIVDGPGIRTVLYVQGCHGTCDGCHNPKTWDTDKGIKIDVADLANKIKHGTPNKKLTISGGEPLLQYDEILELVKKLDDFDIALYTGFELDAVPKEIIKYLKYIKVGRFIKEEICTTMPYIGSKNQKFIYLRGCHDERNIF